MTLEELRKVNFKYKKGGRLVRKALIGWKSKKQKEAEKLEQNLIAKNQAQFAEVGVYDLNSSIGRDITSPDYDWKNYDPADRVRLIFGKPTSNPEAEFKINNPVSNDFETLNNYLYNSPPIEDKINGYNSETGLNEIRNFGQNRSRFGGNLDNKARKYGLTADQVADFLRSYGNELTVDGDLGPKTLEAMYRAGRLKRSVAPKEEVAAPVALPKVTVTAIKTIKPNTQFNWQTINLNNRTYRTDGTNVYSTDGKFVGHYINGRIKGAKEPLDPSKKQPTIYHTWGGKDITI